MKDDVELVGVTLPPTSESEEVHIPSDDSEMREDMTGGVGSQNLHTDSEETDNEDAAMVSPYELYAYA